MTPTAHPAGTEQRRDEERRLRRKLGIPDEARHVLMFVESTHWDPNWMRTSEQYYRWRVQRTLDEALDELRAEPERIFDIECVFYLRMYWERRPQRRDEIRALVNEGRLRLTGSGVTTPDTLLPRTESLIRDYLVGQEWLRSHGMRQEPELAYFPDCFGHAPTLPSLLQSMGFPFACVTRIDGMYFVGCDYEWPGRFPKPGSSAELLQSKKALDFVWRDAAGAAVLCHWNALNYAHGELLAHSGITRVMGLPLALPHRTSRHVARRIDLYARQLREWSPTPYLLCVSGFDFASPIHGLCRLLQRYNQEHYPRSGTWAVNAGMDDYMRLVDCHRDDLPVVELDPNPYWTGFYAARPTLKEMHTRLVDDLVLCEKLALAGGSLDLARRVAKELEPAWYIAAVGNHHDFVTGTAPDAVWRDEQKPWLETARTIGARLLEELAPAGPVPPARGRGSRPTWTREGGRLLIESSELAIEIDARAGGTVRARRRDDDRDWLLPGSLAIVDYDDSGGLWRMGHELRGGYLHERAARWDGPAEVEIHERDDSLEVEIRSRLDGERITRWIRLGADLPILRLRSELTAPARHTLVTRLTSAIRAERIFMDAPGGVVERPRQKLFDPTFWPVSSFWRIADESGSISLVTARPASIACRADGRIEVVVARNATKERVFGFLPVLGHPAKGHDAGPVGFDFSVILSRDCPRPDSDLVRHARRDVLAHPNDEARRAALGVAEQVVRIDGPGTTLAVKAASRGSGLIVRIAHESARGAPIRVRLPSLTVRRAWLCDGRERDIEALEVVDGAVTYVATTTIATLRIDCVER